MTAESPARRFDRYIAVDWSAANEPRLGKDSIWIAELGPEGPVASINPPTRAAATAIVMERLTAARRQNERVFVGFDFVFGYPRGAARAMAGKAGWQAVWKMAAQLVEDAPTNRSNRFELAAELNRRIEMPHFWGHPPHHVYADLGPRRPDHGYAIIAEHRRAEKRIRGPQSVWKLTGAGSVGSQTLLGIPRLAAIRKAFPEAAIWPFETDFAAHLAPITIAEIYPSMFPLPPDIEPRDRAQVETYVARCAALDLAGKFGQFLSAPADLTPEERRDIVEEEGWIAGVGHESLLTSVRQPHLTDPARITAQSFAIIRAEAVLDHLPASLHPIARRMIHACGMVEIAPQLRGTSGLADALKRALAAGAPILCDCETVRAAITRKIGNEKIVALNEPGVAESAAQRGTTRSAAAVELWRDRLAGAIVVIGNEPTALFRLLDLLAEGSPVPSAIIATPVGFVGAAESKAALVAEIRNIPYVTLLGRRGGSAMAAAALNAIVLGEGQ